MKSTNFSFFTYIGDPINAVRMFNRFRADELIILDIEASKKSVPIDLRLVQEIAEETQMPFSVGGGIRSIEQIRALFKTGADKVIINTAALERTDFIREAADHFGSSSITVCVDVQPDSTGEYQVYDHRKRLRLNQPYLHYLQTLEEMGAGEIILQSVERDGTMSGYDTTLYTRAAQQLRIPLVALGGAATLQSMIDLRQSTAVNSFAAGSMFVYHDAQRGVLINYPTQARNEFQ